MKRYRIFLLSSSLLLGVISAMAKNAAEWYRLIPGDTVAVEASSPVTRMYGLAHRGRLEKMGVTLTETIEESPRFPLRILNHWDNLDGTIERGYAGRSLWRWDELPDSVSPRYRWKDACLSYFATFHNLPIPDDVTPSVHNIDELKHIHLDIDNYTCPSPLLLDSLR